MVPPNVLYWSKLLAIGAVIGGVTIGLQFFAPKSEPQVDRAAVLVPTVLSTEARVGKAAFDANCAQCHGANGAGTDKGPPLIHPIYNPGHHPDESFFNAAHFGVMRHHWNFGDMPPRPGVGDADLKAIVVYVREIQQANGIIYQQHHM